MFRDAFLGLPLEGAINGSLFQFKLLGSFVYSWEIQKACGNEKQNQDVIKQFDGPLTALEGIYMKKRNSDL